MVSFDQVPNFIELILFHVQFWECGWVIIIITTWTKIDDFGTLISFWTSFSWSKLSGPNLRRSWPRFNFWKTSMTNPLLRKQSLKLSLMTLMWVIISHITILLLLSFLVSDIGFCKVDIAHLLSLDLSRGELKKNSLGVVWWSWMLLLGEIVQSRETGVRVGWWEGTVGSINHQFGRGY